MRGVPRGAGNATGGNKALGLTLMLVTKEWRDTPGPEPDTVALLLLFDPKAAKLRTEGQNRAGLTATPLMEVGVGPPGEQ